MALVKIPTQRKPEWLRFQLPKGKNFQIISGLLKENHLSTVCQEARCPNIGECWGGGTATFMLMGEICTRKCKFCDISHFEKLKKLDTEEPRKIVESARKLNLDYVVLTCVSRDDLPDQGASHLASAVSLLKQEIQNIKVEILTTDFRGELDLVKTLLNSHPHVFAHNLETVERLTPMIRDPRNQYKNSLKVLEYSKKNFPEIYTKSTLILGFGEERDEIIQSMKDLLNIGVDTIVLSQYLQPSKRNYPVARYITPQEFNELKDIAYGLGFKMVVSGPMVRTSYRAGEVYRHLKENLEKNDQVRL